MRYEHCYLVHYHLFTSLPRISAFNTALQYSIRSSRPRHYSSSGSSTDNNCNSIKSTAIKGSNSNINSMWDPVSQTYKDGIVPSHHSAMSIHALLEVNDGKLKIFGYGSLCWHPGTDGVLSLANISEDEHDADVHAKSRRQVTTAPGRAIGYQRCWSQRSADHRGTVEFNGIVCTLLSDDEVWTLHHRSSDENDSDGKEMEKRMMQQPSMTEGLIYTVEKGLVDDCLAELDFREKGGYARDVIDVIEDDTGNTVKCLLYRGTPDNPAFWKRVLLDLPYAAAVISVAIGPSGPNDVYLLHLHEFLTHAAQHSRDAAMAMEAHSGDVHTGELANMVQLLQTKYRPYFVFGSGSNEHDQLLLRSRSGIDKSMVDIERVVDKLESDHEVHELTEMLLIVPRKDENSESDTRHDRYDPKSIHAGGGHSALLTEGGDLYLWGWNDAGQCGRAASFESILEQTTISPFNVIHPLSNIKVETVDLGHTHSLVIEKNTGRLFGFGENGRGQISGSTTDSTTTSCYVPRTPTGLSEESFVDVAAGLFHSAAITKQGELLTWGCGRFKQCLQPTDASSSASTIGRWRPDDGSKLVQVACGRRHTLALDEHGRLWTLGDNKYGQLGRSVDPSVPTTEPQLVDGPLGHRGSGALQYSADGLTFLP